MESNGVKPGDELEFEQKGNSLCINIISNGQKEKTSIDVTPFDVALEKIIYSVYKKGYDEIELYSSNQELLNQVQRIILEIVVGFEIVSHSPKSCIIRSVVEMTDSEFAPIMRRTFLLLHSMEEGILNSITNNDVPSLSSFRQMEPTNNRYTGFCRRLLNKRGYGEPKNEKLLYCLIEFLEKIADEYKFLCDYLLGHKNDVKKISEAIIRIFRRVSQLSRKIERLYYKFEIKEYLEIYRERKDIIKTINQIYPTEKSPNTILLHYILNTTQFYIDITNFILTMNL